MPSGSDRGLCLLIADDEFIIRKGLLSLDWASAGISDVLTAADGLSARQSLMDHNVDIVITDIRMPGLGGLEIADYVKSCCPHTKVIILSGFGEFEYAKKAIEANVSYYLLKPINPDELMKSARAVAEDLSREKRKEELLSLYEETQRSVNAAEQFLRNFRDSGGKILDVLTYMTKNYDQPLSLSSLAEEFHFNAIYVSHMIKKETGYSFLEILSALRLVNASHLIRQSNMKIVDICERTGFKDQRYFSQIFKKVFEVTPHDYRKLAAEPKDYTIMQLLEVLNGKR